MDLADRILKLIESGEEKDWDSDRTLKKIKKLYESERGSCKEHLNIKKFITLPEYKGDIYQNVSEALKVSTKGDIIVLAGGIYKIFKTYKDYIEYLKFVWDKWEKWIPHFQIVPSDEIQNFVIICDGAVSEDINTIKQQLLNHFKSLQLDHIKCVKMNEEEVAIIMKSLYGTYGECDFQLKRFIKSVVDEELRAKLSRRPVICDDATGKLYSKVPILRNVDDDIDCLASHAVSVTINIIGDHNTVNTTVEQPKKTKRDQYIQWINENPPKKNIMTKYYNLFLKENDSDYSPAKFSALMEKLNYQKTKIAKGLIWVKKDDEEDDS
jgi:hypothetical protein